MCLSHVFRGKKKREELAKLPDTITCWKIVHRQGNQHGSRYFPEYRSRYFPEYRHGSSCFLAGWNKTKPFMKYSCGYMIAFHAFRTKKAAKEWMGRFLSNLYVVKCKTRKKDIVAIGEQYDNNLCIVTKRIWIPKPKKKIA